MNFRTTFVLLALVLVVGLVWFLKPARAPEDEKPKQPEAKTQYLFEPQPDSAKIVNVRFERAGKPAMVFERVSAATPGPGGLPGGEWRMLEPVAAGVEAYMVTNLASTFARLESKSAGKAGSGDMPSLADAGLSPPSATITMTDDANKTYAVEVGKKAPMSNDTYARVAGKDEIHIIGRDLSFDIKREPKDFRSKTLTRMNTNDVTQLTVTHEGKTYALQRAPTNDWVMSSPVPAYADLDKMRTLLSKLPAITVVDFVDDAPASLATYGLDKPFASVQVTAETKKPRPQSQPTTQPASQPAEPQFDVVTTQLGLLIGAYSDLKSENRYIKLADQPWVATAGKANLEALVPADVRDTRVTRLRQADVNKLELSAGGQTATLTRSEGFWHGEGDLAALDASAVNDVVAALEEIRALDFVDEGGDLGKFGLKEPRVVLRAWRASSVDPVVINIGDATASKRNTYIQRAGQPGVMVVAASQADRLLVSPISLRSRAIFDANPEEVREIELTRGDQKYVLHREGAAWRLTSPVEAPAEAAAARDLANDLTRLRAKRVVSKGGDAELGLNSPQIVVRFVLEHMPASAPATSSAPAQEQPPAPQRSEHLLRIVKREANTFCTRDDDPYVYELDETVFRVFTTELIKRAIFDFAADDILGITIDAPGGRLAFEKQGADWKLVEDPFVKLNQKTLVDFAKELAGLAVESFVAYRDGDLGAGGLAGAPVTATLRLKGDRVVTLKVAQQQTGQLPRLAAWVENGCIFLMRQADAEKLLRGLDLYIKPEKEEEPKPSQPQMPGDDEPPGP
ncbi:MAG: DUF4340 domain-containing protein [Phycisphaerae bacterium]